MSVSRYTYPSFHHSQQVEVSYLPIIPFSKISIISAQQAFKLSQFRLLLFFSIAIILIFSIAIILVFSSSTLLPFSFILISSSQLGRHYTCQNFFCNCSRCFIMLFFGWRKSQCSFEGNQKVYRRIHRCYPSVV